MSNISSNIISFPKIPVSQHTYSVNNDENHSDRSSRSHRSSKSRSSHRTNNSDSLRLDAARRKAVLETELRYHDVEAAHQSELRKIQVQKELAKTNAELEAIDKERSLYTVDETDCKTTSSHIDNKDLFEKYLETQVKSLSPQARHEPTEPTSHTQTQTMMSPHAAPFIPTSTPQDNTLSQLVELLSQRWDEDALPKPEPDVFSGDLMKYQQWTKSYDTLVESRVKSIQEKLYYLGRYTSGEAKESISGLLQLSTEDAYYKAKKTLKDRFGNPYMLAEDVRRKLKDWPKISSQDGIGLRKFSDYLQHCKSAMENSEYLTILNDPHENEKLLKKLPNHIVNRWGRVIDGCTAAQDFSDDEEDRVSKPRRAKGSFPSFAEFCKFLKKESRISCNPVISHVFQKDNDDKRKDDRDRNSKFAQQRRRNHTTFATTAESTEKSSTFTQKTTGNETRKPYCHSCKEQHDMDSCLKFLELPLPDRRKFINQKGLCNGCLTYGHMRKDCRIKKTCKLCKMYHPTSLHDEELSKKHEKKISNEEAVTNCIKEFGDCSDITSQIVPVRIFHTDHTERSELIYALIDEQSDSCFMIEDLCEALNLHGTNVELKLSTVNGTSIINTTKYSGLVVQGYNEESEVHLPPLYSRNTIPVRRGQIPRLDVCKNWPHFQDILSTIMPYRPDVKVGLLIGINCTRATKPIKIIPGKQDEPYAIQTLLGWSIIGMTNPDCHQHNAERSEREVKKNDHFVFRTTTKELMTNINQMFDLDFTDRNEENFSLSWEDKRFMKIAQENVIQQDNGKYQLPLPFKKDEVILPDNKELAVKRLNGLKKRLNSDENYKQDYFTFMNKIIQNGFAEKVPIQEIEKNDGHKWFIPHHGVYHPLKKKIRVVFDCSAQYQGESLNQNLLQGPDLTNNLTEVLCRFRKENIAVTCDIEAMFHQVHVENTYRDYLRFLWWENCNLSQQPIEYRMTVHLFGATSSPSCANYALKKTVDDHGDDYGQNVADFVRKQFYVDDGLSSVSTVQEAYELIQDTRELCKHGGFNLTQFMSNSKQLLQMLSPEEKAKGVKDLDLTNQQLPIDRALGVQWCAESDSLVFRITLKDKPLTRRGVLSTVSSVFDPLGLVSPYILVGKRILQELCRHGVDWDDCIPDSLRPRWEKWRNDIFHLAQIKIQRCYKPESFGSIKNAELHHFSDASQDGYGQCSYLKLVNQRDEVQCSLVIAKARVSPLRPVTIPRLELTAAHVSAKVSSFLKVLEYEDLKNFYWTDSKVVLGYISNEARRFHVFVANRVQAIRDISKPSQWSYVPSKDNPADLASRIDLTAQEFVKSSLWWNGPEFLWNKTHLPTNEPVQLLTDDPEIKAVTTHKTSTEENSALLGRLIVFSDWYRVKRAIAVCLRLQMKIKQKLTPGDDKIGGKYLPVNVQEIQLAEKEIIKLLQKQEFGEELKTLKAAVSTQSGEYKIRSTSSLYKLDPILDDDGIIRVGGRIKNSTLEDKAKNPIILPKKTHVTELIIRHYHEKSKHQGRGITHNEIRSSGYWIIDGNSSVAYYISRCVSCQRLRGVTQNQKMSELPADRLEPSPPFTYCSVDCFGPFYIKERRSEIKRYGVLFTCNVSRAIHLEVSNDMSTDSFINAYRRFVGRRGPVRQIRSDQGSNFVGTRNELQAALEEMDNDKIRRQLLKDDCDFINFKMNVPHSSHMGGVWERQIRTVRNVLTVILDNHKNQIDDELLRTFFVEAETIVNSRPLTSVTSEPDLPCPLSPNNLLWMKTAVVRPPPGIFQDKDIYSKRRWRRVQTLSNQFWTRWRKEYLSNLQERQKWNRTRRNAEIGDVVILKSDDEPRNRWQLARVVATYPSSDGRIRKVKLLIGDQNLDKNGRSIKPRTFLERPIHQIILLVPNVN